MGKQKLQCRGAGGHRGAQGPAAEARGRDPQAERSLRGPAVPEARGREVEPAQPRAGRDTGTHHGAPSPLRGASRSLTTARRGGTRECERLTPRRPSARRRASARCAPASAPQSAEAPLVRAPRPAYASLPPGATTAPSASTRRRWSQHGTDRRSRPASATAAKAGAVPPTPRTPGARRAAGVLRASVRTTASWRKQHS
jgi:hypothetical protein